jgi:hypothetical protein
VPAKLTFGQAVPLWSINSFRKTRADLSLRKGSERHEVDGGLVGQRAKRSAGQANALQSGKAARACWRIAVLLKK